MFARRRSGSCCFRVAACALFLSGSSPRQKDLCTTVTANFLSKCLIERNSPEGAKLKRQCCVRSNAADHIEADAIGCRDLAVLQVRHLQPTGLMNVSK